MLKRNKDKRIISQLQDSKGRNCHTRTEKKKIVQEFYSELYKQGEEDVEKIKKYILSTDMPSITDDQREILNKPITTTELDAALKKLKSNKTPGPYGIPGELYKAVQGILGEKMLEVYNEALEDTKIPQSWTEALITIIHKDETDPQLIQNNRPISLLNTDYKIFAIIIAERLKKILNNYIHKDQNGFLPGRQIGDNLRIILNTLEYYEVHPEREFALVFLDAQKAFDNLNWTFLKQQLKNMKLGSNLENIIGKLYTKQSAKVIPNDDMTDQFYIMKGVK